MKKPETVTTLKSRSVQRREALMKGEPMPTFAGGGDMRRMTKRQTINNLRDSNEALGKIVDRMMMIDSVSSRDVSRKLITIAGIINGVHNGNTDPSVACRQIADVLGEPF